MTCIRALIFSLYHAVEDDLIVANYTLPEMEERRLRLKRTELPESHYFAPIGDCHVLIYFTFFTEEFST